MNDEEYWPGPIHDPIVYSDAFNPYGQPGDLYINYSFTKGLEPLCYLYIRQGAVIQISWNRAKSIQSGLI